jgi:hypothetical protein
VRQHQHPLNPTPGVCSLILYLSVDCSEILALGKAFRWSRPSRCPACEGLRLWGHGYVDRYFDGVPERIPLKRWRCPDCHAVHTMRPVNYWRGFLADKDAIFTSLLGKERHGYWLEAYPRQRQQYWWRGFRRQRGIQGRQLSVRELVDLGGIAATHSLTHRETRPYRHPPHLIFAYTAPVRGP